MYDIKEQERLAKDSSAPDVFFKSLLYRPEKLHRLSSPISHFSFIPVGISRHHRIIFLSLFFFPLSIPPFVPFRAFRAVSRFVFHFGCLFFPFDTSQCLFNHSSDCFYLSGTRVKTLSFATRKLPPRRRSHIQPLLIPRFKDNPNFESGFTSRSLPLITNYLVILSAIFHPSLFFFFPCPTAFSRPHFPWLRLAVGAGLLPNRSGL